MLYKDSLRPFLFPNAKNKLNTLSLVLTKSLHTSEIMMSLAIQVGKYKWTLTQRKPRVACSGHKCFLVDSNIAIGIDQGVFPKWPATLEMIKNFSAIFPVHFRINCCYLNQINVTIARAIQSRTSAKKWVHIVRWVVHSLRRYGNPRIPTINMYFI